MEQVGEFYRHAQDCRAMAGKQKNQKFKTVLLALASQWEELAKAREDFIHTRLASPDRWRN